MKSCVRFALLAFVLAVRPARAEPPEPPSEPPPEAGEGDYTLESPDSLGDDELELAVAAAGGSRSGIRRSQRVSFRGGGMRGTLRDGDDVLAGGRIQTSVAGGTLAAGRMAPRWARGLVLGGAADPWARRAEDRGEGAVFRGRAGDGLVFESGHASLLAGRFHRLALSGGRWATGPAAFGVLVARHGVQASGGWEGESHALELAFDQRGRWRAETAFTGQAGESRLALRVRGGLGAFRPLAEPARAGPPQAIVASAERTWNHVNAANGTHCGDEGRRPSELNERSRQEGAPGSKGKSRGGGGIAVAAFGSLWRWQAGQDGARGALEVTTRLGQHASFAAGMEQQQGARREPSPRMRATGPRQGLWCEWRGGSPEARLTLRHELWGARAFAREAVRRAVVARADFTAAQGIRIGFTHAVWLVRRGENLYLPEPGADRLVLRASSGAGSRTRAELRIPIVAGDIRLGLALATGGTRAGVTPPAWTVEWSRRSQLALQRKRPP